MRTRMSVAATAVGVLALGGTLAACGSSSSGGSTGGTTPPPTSATSPSTSAGAGFSYLTPNSTGTPKSGGTLTVLGSSDVDYLDPNITYYTVGYMAAREYSRQLYTYPATPGQTTTVVPDLATAAPIIGDGGKTETITIKTGAMWDTTPKPTQVTAKDEQLGVEMTCNPSQPFGGTVDFSSLIVGYTKFCAGFAKAPATPAGIKAYVTSHSISGITVGSTPETIVFHLTQPATYFESELALPALSPRSSATLAYLPASAEEAQHTISDGPYKVQTYQPGKELDFVRNPAWSASTDSVRHAYVDAIDIKEGLSQSSIEQQILTNSPSADMQWDLGATPVQINQLINQKSPNINVQSEISSNPYLVFNTASPNNNGALKSAAVRGAISEAIDRADLIQDAGGTRLAPPLTHILPPTIDGSVNKSYFPYSIAKAKAALAAAGATNLTLKFLYRNASTTSTTMYQDIQAQLKKVGINVVGVPASESGFYVKYLEVPSTAESGQWDLALAGWGPDWYGNAALSFFEPLFNGKVFPPSSSNFGLFNDPKVNKIIQQASVATSLSQSNALWEKADEAVMKAAAIYPIDDPNGANLHGTQVHNDIYLPALENFDFTNVWLS